MSGLHAADVFVSYTYSYPHKTAHRPLEPPVPLAEVWGGEPRGALFLYFHVPFCENRCGFCNLFSLARPPQDLRRAYLATIRRQARRVMRAMGDASFARLAVGGGTPTWLEADELGGLFRVAEEVLGCRPRDIPVSVEASPGTVAPDKLALLRELGVNRLSLGVQSFDPRDAAALGRSQPPETVRRAIGWVRQAGFATLNIDLMYGGPGQTLASWLATVREAIAWRPEELYLYPLYVRPLTGLGRKGLPWEDRRLEFYRHARAMLLEAGYGQASFRMFRAGGAAGEDGKDTGQVPGREAGPVYCCQEDGMVGLGCGARSYTRRLHYSHPYAVPAAAVRDILEAFVRRSDESFDAADHGIWLDEEDQRRRYVVLSLLQGEGLSLAGYRRRFGGDALADLPQLAGLLDLGWARTDGESLRLTAAGVERSDAIGPWLCSARVRRRMETYAWRTD